ncbi:antibiotic biosynthesis monooxygenase [Rhodococcus olei]|uniref:Antibiotic biosynthesis monooxygenase n=1 Tax=Rhodococcus olei TaxID=2161675 RepID=A0ABP8PJG1_9NOCA
MEVDRWRHRGAAPSGKGPIVYARSTTIQAQPTSIDDGVTHVRDVVMPALEGIDGCVGLSLLVDRESGRCIVTTAWESEEAMRAAAERVRPLRERAAEMFGGTTEVEEWDIAVLHRDHRSHEGACVRAIWVKVEPDQADRAIDIYKVAALPMMEDLEGFCSASLLVDRATGRAVSSETFDSLEALDRNREKAAADRLIGIQEAGAEVLEVCEFELALAHLRVPELA